MIQKFLTIGKEEEEAVLRVIRSGNLSGFVASSSKAGAEVTLFEAEWESAFGGYAVSCNSATSGLLAACMAAGVGPMDEVIVPYFTMSATACAPAVLGATIILADIEPETFCLDPNDVGRQITENTKAVIATNMFGHPAKLKQLRSMCDSRGIILIEDNAQAIMAREDGEFTGTIGHMGVFSLNVHKHIQTGEGGMVMTKDGDLLMKLHDAINHGECRHQETPGLNLRMTELTAAVGREQLKKLPRIVASRQLIASHLAEIFSRFEFLGVPKPRAGCDHTYYAFSMLVDPSEEYNPSTIVDWIRARNPIPVSLGYHGNLLTMTVSNKWLTPQRQMELLDTDVYRSLGKLMLIETCSYDIKLEHLDELRRRLSDH
jgi:dTDP-4-amino-4,6-dideoxygalactose transaminase